MGDFDLVPSVLIKIGFEILFDQVAIQPGKPTVFGRYENKFVFGIPVIRFHHSSVLRSSLKNFSPV